MFPVSCIPRISLDYLASGSKHQIGTMNRLAPGWMMDSPLVLIRAAFLYIGIHVSPVSAAPSGADLLVACEHSLANDFRGIEGQMCIWYVTPCDCSYTGSKEMPRVCLPRAVPVETLAREVIDGLQEATVLLNREADVAAALVLAEKYPCSE